MCRGIGDPLFSPAQISPKKKKIQETVAGPLRSSEWQEFKVYEEELEGDEAGRAKRALVPR